MITLQDAYTAYRKLKSYVYFDNSALHLKDSIAVFECNLLQGDSDFKTAFEKKIGPLLTELNSSNFNIEKFPVFQSLLNGVSYKLVPKSVSVGQDYQNNTDLGYITNEPTPGPYTVDSYNVLISAPIEIYIISVLWLMKVAKMLDGKITEYNYAYRLSIKDIPHREDREFIDIPEEELSSGLMLFEPYYKGYQDWRDNAIAKALAILEENNDATLLSLDIQRYFYSVRMNLLSAFVNLNQWNEHSDELHLIAILQRIHQRYTEAAIDVLPIALKEDDIEAGKYPLPVGLPSSGWLGNYYLRKFDRKVIEAINPAYYGRYVDDILFVFRDRNISRGSGTQKIAQFIRENFIMKCVMKEDEEDEDNSDVRFFIEVEDNRLIVQSKKVLLEHFRHNESRAAINKFKKNVDNNRSEFRFLPFEDRVDVDFDDEAFSLEYSDSVNKLRSVKQLSEDRFGASKYLAHKLFLSSIPIDCDDAEINAYRRSANQILTYFRGKTAIDMWALWEKVATYFFINRDSANLMLFYRQAYKSINELKPSTLGDTETNELEARKIDILKSHMREYLEGALAMPFALYPEESDKFRFKNNTIKFKAERLRKALMFRQNILPVAALGYTEYNDDCVDLRETPWRDVEKFRLASERFALRAPIFLHLHDVNLLSVFHNITNDNISSEEQYNGLYSDYYKFNYQWRISFENRDILIRESNLFHVKSEDSASGIRCSYID